MQEEWDEAVILLLKLPGHAPGTPPVITSPISPSAWHPTTVMVRCGLIGPFSW
jgi:hypothetical protein